MRFRVAGFVSAARLAVAISAAALAGASVSACAANDGRRAGRPVPEGAVEHILVIDLENEDFATTFGANSPAAYAAAPGLRAFGADVFSGRGDKK